MGKTFNILALETSADETSAAVLTGNKRPQRYRLRSNVIYSQIAMHRRTGGIVPEVAARAHIPKIIPAITAALRRAKTTLREIDCIAVTAGPGLVTSLMVGVDTAKALAFALGKPIIPINHMEGHLLSATAQKSLRFPALGLVVSGGHTMLVLVRGIGRYRVLGQTRDDAAGEAFDKTAKILGLPYPGGAHLAKLARRGDPAAFALPRPMLERADFDFSFAGLKTSVLYLWQKLRQSPRQKADLAAGIQAAIVEVLVGKTIAAAKQYRVKTVLLGGGVAANQKLRADLAAQIRRETRATLLVPKAGLSTDNAGMIAGAAFWHWIYGDTAAFAQIRLNPNLQLKSWR